MGLPTILETLRSDKGELLIDQYLVAKITELLNDRAELSDLTVDIFKVGTCVDCPEIEGRYKELSCDDQEAIELFASDFGFDYGIIYEHVLAGDLMEDFLNHVGHTLRWGDVMYDTSTDITVFLSTILIDSFNTEAIVQAMYDLLYTVEDTIYQMEHADA